MMPVVATAASHLLTVKAPSRTRNSPTKPFKPGRPSEDSDTIRNSAEKAGITAQRPPNSEISRVCRRS